MLLGQVRHPTINVQPGHVVGTGTGGLQGRRCGEPAEASEDDDGTRGGLQQAQFPFQPRSARGDWEYWWRPVPGLGPSDAALAIIGLAPAATAPVE
ncbi:hypothetical protein GCM10010381_66930 [Streptomyces xantholiticus]|nr:hypothetical protein GCM10010381_66930 [Streptomyces xantholiticus]